MQYNFQPKIGRKIRIFRLGRKNIRTGDNELNLHWCNKKEILRNLKTNANPRFTKYNIIMNYIILKKIKTNGSLIFL